MPESNIQVVIDNDDDGVQYDPDTGTLMTRDADGGVVVQLDAYRQQDDEPSEFFDNLTEDIDGQKLAQIANDLIEQINADDASRQEHLQIIARAMSLLGIKLEEPKSTVGDASGNVDGISSVTNPLMLDACLKGWANAQAELLPADGPVKIRDDGDETSAEDDLAETLERDVNHYLTKVATEYYPDTSHMLLWGTYFKGSGFKKVYRCPMRQRPVSESVDQKDLIVSDNFKDLRSCSRITHQIMMRPSVMKRMKLVGAYRDVALTQPTPTVNVVDAKIAGIQGTQAEAQRPEDQPYTILETQCELDLDEFAPEGFKGEGIPLPYLVTLDKDSREILAIRRDWDEDDENCQRKRMYVRYQYVPGPGFYGTGMIGILGNASAAMTAAWRECLDAGMLANFPAFLIAKLSGRQNTSDLRVAPGTAVPIETGNLPIGQVAMKMPYSDVTPGILALMDKITNQAQGLSGAADVPTAEGVQNVPVGTMLAQIEQATKVIAAAHKGMHQAQSEEFDLLLDIFRQFPEDFIRNVPARYRRYWNVDKFIQALDNVTLVPVSDPNVPSHIHRVAKAIALVQLQTSPLGAFQNPKEALRRVYAAMREDPNGLLVDPPPQAGGAPQDPAKMIEAQAKAQDAQTNQLEAQLKASQIQQQGQLDQQKLAAEQSIQNTELQREAIIHQNDATSAARDQQQDQIKTALEAAKAVRDQAQQSRQQSIDASLANRQQDLAERQHQLDVTKATHDMANDQQQHGLGVAGHALDVAQAKHDAKMDVKEFNKPQPRPKPKT